MKNSKKLAIISLLLGFGLGLATSSIINLLYPTVKYVEYSEEEIKNMAKQLGMMEVKEYDKIEEEMENYQDQNNDEDTQKTDIVNDNEEGEVLSEKEEENQNIEDKLEEEYITFTIEKGEKSEKIIDDLFNAGIIENKDEFIDLVVKRKLGRKFIYGTYNIKRDINYDELLNLLCGE